MKRRRKAGSVSLYLVPDGSRSEYVAEMVLDVDQVEARGPSIPAALRSLALEWERFCSAESASLREEAQQRARFKSKR